MTTVRKMPCRIIVVTMLLLTSPGAVFAETISHAPEPEYWPTEGWRTSTPEAQGLTSEKLADMFEFIQRKDAAIRSVVIIRNGYLVVDAALYPYQHGARHNLYSATKSVIATLIGLALKQGAIEGVNQKVVELFPNRTIANLDDNKRAMTLEHVLTMATGLKCEDSPLHGEKGMFEMQASQDWIQYVLDLPMREQPGTTYEYCNGASHLLSAILQERTGVNALTFAKEHLFAPLGISEVNWLADPQGITRGWSDLFLSPQDLAKIGFLYLQQGQWNGTQLLSSDWVVAATKEQHDPKTGPSLYQTWGESYGYQWWTYDAGYAAMQGFGGQLCVVIPEKNMVVVFNGALDWGQPKSFLENYILFAAGSSESLPDNPAGMARLTALIDALASPPEATPPATLPEIAAHISGKTYMLDANELEWTDISWSFESGKDEAEVVMGVQRQGERVQSVVNIGLDNVFRRSSFADPFMDAEIVSRGSWRNETNFVAETQLIDTAEILDWSVTFTEDTINIRIMHEVTGQYLIIPGKMK